MPNTTPKKINLSVDEIDAIARMRDGWTLRWQRSSKHKPFLHVRAGLSDATRDLDESVFFDLIAKGLVKSMDSRSIIEYYHLTSLGKSISL